MIMIIYCYLLMIRSCPVNACTQYEPRTFSEEEQERVWKSEEMQEFMNNVTPRYICIHVHVQCTYTCTCTHVCTCIIEKEEGGREKKAIHVHVQCTCLLTFIQQRK